MSFLKRLLPSRSKTGASTCETLRTQEDFAEKCHRLEEQNRYLNLYLQELVNENKRLQGRNDDLKITVKENKQLLGTPSARSSLAQRTI